MSSKQEVTEKDWKYLKFFWFLNVIAVALLITLSFFVPDAEASYHHVAVVGDFEGKYNHNTILAEGEYKVSDNVNTFTLRGDIVKDGRDLTYNINCITIIGQLVLDSQDTQVFLNFDGKECQFGYMSYVFGTFDTTGATGKYAGVMGEGRISFYTDHYSDNVSGTLQGKFRV